MSMDIYFRGNQQIWVQNNTLHVYKIMAGPAYNLALGGLWASGKHDPCIVGSCR